MNPAYTHPYRGRPDTAFWREAVARADPDTFNPVGEVPFRISRTDGVATAGSCFAQHISNAIAADGFAFLQTEPPGSGDVPRYSARYGNIYTCKQLRQTFDRAYGLFRPNDRAWRRKDGRYVDPFRQQEFPQGFGSVDEVEEERERHLDAVRTLFETCRVFVFTLGLTESWIATSDGAALPLPPGVVAAPDEIDTYAPVNQGVGAMAKDLLGFVDKLRAVNPAVRLVLTVSPVPLVATFEARHVLVSNTYSKAALRVVAEEACRQRPDVMYFPSFEMVSAMPRISMFEDDLRSVSPEAVRRVMSVFRATCLTDAGPQAIRSHDGASRRSGPVADEKPGIDVREFSGVICDEDMLGATG